MEFPRNITLIHDWLVTLRGGEKVIEVFCELFPHANILTIVYSDKRPSQIIGKIKIKNSIIQKLPFGKWRYQILSSIFTKSNRIIRLERFRFDNLK